MVLGKRQKIIPDPKRVSKNLNSMWMTTLSQSRLPRHLFQKVQNSSLAGGAFFEEFDGFRTQREV